MNQIRNLTNSSNIIYYYTKDEPFQAHFEMYNQLENLMESEFGTENPPQLITALAPEESDIVKPNLQPYRHYLNFLKSAKPRTIAVDPYALKEADANDLIIWNDDLDPRSVQQRIDRIVTDTYLNVAKAVRHSTESSVRETDIIYIPQTHGQFALNGANVSYWTFFKPPRSMNKCLQFLPLCYSADGIMDYALLWEEVDNYRTPLVLSNANTLADIAIPYHDTAFNHLTEANHKIAVYGPLLQEQNWLNANCLMIDGGDSDVLISQFLLSDLRVKDPLEIPLEGFQPEPYIPSPPYHGYVQCGYYNDDSQSPSFMLVNRRAVYRESGENTPVQNPVDDSFIDANSQVVTFVPSPSATTQFGTYVALFDPYDDSLYRLEGNDIQVNIGPGDGVLLEMCGTLPASVTENSVLSAKAVIQGNVTIQPGVVVTTNAGTTTRLLSNSVISIGAGASYTLRGDVEIEENVSFLVSPSGSLVFENAECTWGENSIITVTGGSLTIDGSTMSNSFENVRWSGIRTDNSSLVTISDATISNARNIIAHNSDLYIFNSNFHIPPGTTGLNLTNTESGHQTQIINTEPDLGFDVNTEGVGMGIVLNTMQNPVTISNVNFWNLYCGINKATISYATDSISECSFINCETGIQLVNNGNGSDIQQCNFVNYRNGKHGTGLKLQTSSPTISTCNFTNLFRGVFTESQLISGFGLESSINESNFYNCEMGIESRDSFHRLKANYFNRNNSGIVNHAGSNLNLSYVANNVFMNYCSNIVFYDTMPYESTIQLFTGHNDFYHLTENSTGISAVDFSFDTNYYDLPISLDYKINASKNWFQDDQVTLNDPTYVDYVYVDVYDPSPSMPAPPPESDRLFVALGYESQGLYDLAGAIYQAIIDDQLDEEKSHITSAIDGLYRCKMMIQNPQWDLSEYLVTKANQTAIDQPTLSAILKDYLAKVFVLNKDFQAAVDLIQPRIDNPISEVDSLRAILDLEIVLQLAAMEEDKRPLTTKYTQYQYPDIQVFDAMHSINWDRYNQVLHENDPDNLSPIASVPLIQSNYPNPFNPSTTIAFSIPETGRARVSIYNIRGQIVKDLLNGELTRGNHRLVWDGRDANNSNVASGIYFIKLESGGKTSIRKAMLLK